MARRVLSVGCSVLLLLSIVSGWAAAYSAYDTVFCRYGPKTGITTTFPLWTPTRTGGNDSFPSVTSKWNQPRVVDEPGGESNPHLGCDLGVQALTVYPLFRGWVDHVDGTNGVVVVYLDLDGDNIRDDVCWAHYNHLSRIDVSEGTAITASTPLGISGSDHLHFGVQKSWTHSAPSGGLWAPLERYYPQGWHAGQDLDYICTIKNQGNVVKATAYVMNNGSPEYLHSGDVWLCHRKAGTSDVWQQEAMTLVPGSSKEWQFNLTGKYPSKTSVAYMVIAQRDISASYKWGIFPAKFYQPAAPDPDESRAYDYLTISLQ
jgi:hypothetical protein